MFYGGLESSQYSDSVICLVKVKISNKKNTLSPNGNVKKIEICSQGKDNTTIRDVKITLLGS